MANPTHPTAASIAADELHEQWRAAYRAQNGENAERWKPMKPESVQWVANKGDVPASAIRQGASGAEINIAALPNSLLPPQFSGENTASATGAIEAINKNPGASVDKLAAIVHDQWVERNSWASPELKVPYEQLSDAEKAKDIAVVRVAEKANEAASTAARAPSAMIGQTPAEPAALEPQAVTRPTAPSGNGEAGASATAPGAREPQGIRLEKPGAFALDPKYEDPRDCGEIYKPMVEASNQARMKMTAARAGSSASRATAAPAARESQGIRFEDPRDFGEIHKPMIEASNRARTTMTAADAGSSASRITDGWKEATRSRDGQKVSRFQIPRGEKWDADPMGEKAVANLRENGIKAKAIQRGGIPIEMHIEIDPSPENMTKFQQWRATAATADPTAQTEALAQAGKSAASKGLLRGAAETAGKLLSPLKPLVKPLKVVAKVAEKAALPVTVAVVTYEAVTEQGTSAKDKRYFQKERAAGGAQAAAAGFVSLPLAPVGAWAVNAKIETDKALAREDQRMSKQSTNFTNAKSMAYRFHDELASRGAHFGEHWHLDLKDPHNRKVLRETLEEKAADTERQRDASKPWFSFGKTKERYEDLKSDLNSLNAAIGELQNYDISRRRGAGLAGRMTESPAAASVADASALYHQGYNPPSPEGYRGSTAGGPSAGTGPRGRSPHR